VTAIPPASPHGHTPPNTPPTTAPDRAPGAAGSSAGRPVRIYAEAVTYRLSLLPEDHPAARWYSVEVTYRGHGRWIATWLGDTLTRDGRWVSEPLPTDIDAEHADATRHTLNQALALARAALPGLVVGGHRHDGAPAHAGQPD
jgi:hypothetical protein